MDEQFLQVLVVEDNPTDVFLLRKALDEVQSLKIVLTQAKRLDEALHCLRDKSFDVVLLDLGLPDSQGLETFSRMQRDHSNNPILILSGLDNESLSVQAVQNGAQDFLVKGRITGKTLARTIRYAIERKRSHQRLIASEAGYRRLFETARDGIFILDAASGQITDVNPCLEEMLGYPRAEFIGKRLWETAPFRDKAANQAAFRTLQEKGRIRYDDLPLATKDGRFLDVEFVSNIYEVGSQQVIQCNIRDITQRKRAEAAEMELQHFLQSTLDALPSHIAVLNDAGEIVAVNEAWRQFSTKNEDTAASCEVGANYIEVCEQASGRWALEGLQIGQGIQGVLKGQHAAFCLEYPCHSATAERWFNVCVTPFVGEGPMRVVVSHENITTRKKAENLISASETNLAKSQQMAHLGSWELELSNLNDINANPLRWSDELFRIFGYEPGQIEVSNEAFFRAVHPEDRPKVNRRMAEAVAGGKPYSIEHRVILPDGRERVVHAQAETIYDEKTGLPIKMMGLGQDITERKQAEAMLRRSEANLATAQQMARLGSWEWELTPHEDWRKNQVHWSDEVFRILGYEPNEVEASLDIFQQALYPDDRARGEAIIAQALLNKSGYSLDHLILRPDGTERFVHEQANFVFDAAGKPLQVIGTVQDITERKQAEEALQKNETKFRTIFETALDAILLANDDGNYVDANPAACALLGLEHGQLMGRSMADSISPATLAATLAAFKDLLRDGQQSGEFEFQQPDGTLRQVEYRAVAGLLPGIHMAVMRDVSERKLAEATLLESEARFRTAIVEAPVPIMIHREDGKVLQISKGWTKYSGYDINDVATIQNWAERAYGEDSAEAHEHIKSLYQIEETRSEGEWTITAKDGQKRVWDFITTPLGTFGDNQRVVINTAFDITESKRAKEALETTTREIVTTWESMTDAFYSLDLQWRFTHINSQGTKLLETTSDALIGTSVWTAFPGTIGSTFEREYRRAMTEQVKVDFEEFYPALGAWFEVHVYPSPAGLSVYFRDITPRKQAEASLIESQQRLSLATESAHIGIWDWDVVANRMVWDAQMIALYGIREEDFTGAVDAWQNGLHPEDREQAEADLTAALNGTRDFRSQFRVVWPNGEVRFIEAHALVQRADDGSPLRMTGINRDITERKLDEAALRRSEERYRSLTLATTQIVWTALADGMMEDMPAWRDFTGQSLEEVQGRGWTQALHSSDRERIEKTIGLCGEIGIFEDEYRVRAANGDYRLFAVRGVPILESDGNIREWVGTFTDIQDHRQTEEERDRFFTISLDMLAIVGKDGYMKRLNPAWETTLGFSNAELMAAPYLEWVHPDDQAATATEDARLGSGNRVMQFENRYRCRDGSYKWLHWMSAPFEDLFYCVAHDVTAMREAEAALHKANDELELHVMERTAELGDANELLRVENIQHQMTMETLREVAKALQVAKEEADTANTAKSEFLSRMSHELRTPLNAILGFGQILDKQQVTPLAKESIGYILKGGRHLLDLINEVLDIARVEAGHLELSLEPIALNDIVPEACALMRTLAGERSIRLDTNMTQLGHSYVLADRQRLKQVLINLIANAIKYNREGGQVEVACSQESDGWISLAVRDTGAGIAPHDLTKLFTPFERLGASTSEVEGTGLGLVLSQRLVTAMGGTLNVKSALGQGSTFTIDLPQTAPPETQVANMPPKPHLVSVEQQTECAYSVLCIEDNPSNLRLMETIFEMRPEITLLTAIQGSIGLDMARQHEPDLILLDLNLPDIHGSEVLTRLQQSGITRDIPVVVVSADATPNQVERLLSAGARDYLTKPLDVGQFLHVVDKFLQAPDAVTTQPQNRNHKEP